MAVPNESDCHTDSSNMAVPNESDCHTEKIKCSKALRGTT
uniref:Uncharacterized protein n=1 Tax=Arundo donax TaxID=35708 RepID=A0A0A9A9U4_ARUDO